MSNVSIKPAVTGRYTHKYNPLAIMSLDYGEFAASRVVEVEKSDQWKFNKVKGTLRLAPQIFPAYGKNTLKSAAFFVPAKQLMESYDQLRNNNLAWKGKVVKVPFFTHHTINDMFKSYSVSDLFPQLSTKVGSSATQDTYKSLTQNGVHVDFVWFDQTTNEWNYYALTWLGKRLYKTLKMLGYDFASYSASGVTAQAIEDSANTPLNAFPLLAFAKVFTDYFINPHMYNSHPLVSFLQHVHDSEDYTVSPYNYVNGKIDSDTLFTILTSIVVPVEHNMYLDAWNSTNSPTGVAPDNQMFDPNQTGIIGPKVPVNQTNGQTFQPEVKSDAQSTFIRDTYGSGSTQLLQSLSVWGQNFLESVFKFARRNNLFGSKPIQQFFARFGIKDADWNSHFASKLYEGVSEIDYSAVVSQSDTENGQVGKTLGSYAGFGVSGLNFNFSYKASDPGYLIVLHWIQLTPVMVHGTDPSVMRIEPLDWYTPEFDGKSIRPIPQMEISIDRGTRLTASGDKNVFGFTDIYEEYRNMRDTVTGDFVTNEIEKNFFFGRDYSFWREMMNNTYANIKPQLDYIQNFYRYANYGDFTNPFQWDVNSGDRYYLYVQYDITANRSISSKSSALELNGEGDLQIQLGGTQIR